MESEFERILKSQKKVWAASPGVLLFLGVTMFVLGLVAGSFIDAWPFASDYCLILAAFIFIGYFQSRQSKVNLEIVKAIKEIRERLDQGVREEDV